MRRRLPPSCRSSSEQVEKLFGGIENTIIGTVYGGLVVAAVQGALIGLALWVFGIPSPVLWGVVAAFFALLPVVGTAAVWVPASIYLLATGHWMQAVILAVWGAFFVGTIDNMLRPYLISGRVQMHTLLIFFAVFGGVNVFGFLGLFIGPVILAVTLTLLSMLETKAARGMHIGERRMPPRLRSKMRRGGAVKSTDFSLKESVSQFATLINPGAVVLLDTFL